MSLWTIFVVKVYAETFVKPTPATSNIERKNGINSRLDEIKIFKSTNDFNGQPSITFSKERIGFDSVYFESVFTESYQMRHEDTLTDDIKQPIQTTMFIEVPNARCVHTIYNACRDYEDNKYIARGSSHGHLYLNGDNSSYKVQKGI